MLTPVYFVKLGCAVHMEGWITTIFWHYVAPGEFRCACRAVIYRGTTQNK